MMTVPESVAIRRLSFANKFIAKITKHYAYAATIQLRIKFKVVLTGEEFLMCCGGRSRA